MDDIAIRDQGIAQFTDSKGRIATSLDMAESAARYKLAAVTAQCDSNLIDEVGAELRVRDYVIYDAAYVDRKTAELVQGVRMILICEDGSSYGTWSKIIMESLQKIVWAKGGWPCGQHLVLAVRSKRKGDRVRYWLEEVV